MGVCYWAARVPPLWLVVRFLHVPCAPHVVSVGLAPQCIPRPPLPQLDPCNERLLRQHLACAAAELPLLPSEDAQLFGAAQLASAVADLLEAGLLARHARALNGAAAEQVPGLAASLHYCGPGRSPAARISLRTIDPERFVILDTTASPPRVLEEVEANKESWWTPSRGASCSAGWDGHRWLV